MPEDSGRPIEIQFEISVCEKSKIIFYTSMQKLTIARKDCQRFLKPFVYCNVDVMA